jgi:hypothetical protein
MFARAISHGAQAMVPVADQHYGWPWPVSWIHWTSLGIAVWPVWSTPSGARCSMGGHHQAAVRECEERDSYSPGSRNSG